MSRGGPLSNRTLVLAPQGRDAAIAEAILTEADLPVTVCADLSQLCRELRQGAGTAVVVEEAMQTADLSELNAWIEAQPPWSDFPFVLLAHRGGGLERNPAAKRLSQSLGNVSFLERPFHPTTLVSIVSTALRGRRRQYEARERIEEIRRGEATLEQRVAERTAELATANEQLAAQIAEREKAEAALTRAQRLEAVGQLTSGVAHDFNNLLTVLLGNVRQLQKAPQDPRTARRLTMMAEAAERGARLTEQMLAFSRRQRLEPQAVDLNETVTRMGDLLASTMGGSVHLETRLKDGLWPAMIDPTQIELVILNLAINARDAMEVGGSLMIETDNVTLGPPRRPEDPAAGEYVMVCVTDTGSGMDEATLARVFEPFFTTKPVGRGSGLGLSQVFGLAKQSGGGVRIETAPGEGTAVQVFLPRASGAASPTASAGGESLPRPVGRPLVLLVDDDAPVREVTAGLLEELGYAVLEADSGAGALKALEEHTDVEAVVLDYAMPGMNGAEVAKAVQARRPEMPVLFASGYADVGTLTQAGEERVVHKPFVQRELAVKLAAALAGGGLGASGTQS